MNLLAKTRKINDLLQKNIDKQDIFKEVSELLSELTQTNIYIISSQGALLGYGAREGKDRDRVQECLENKQHSSEVIAHDLFSLREASAKQNSNRGYPAFPEDEKDLFDNELAAVVPIIGGRERFGTIIMNRLHEPVCQDDRVLAEHVSTLLGLKLRRRKAKRQEKEVRSQIKAQKVIHSLTHSELAAVGFIFQELNGKEGLIVTSELAKKYSISRSVLIVGLRKLKTAGVIESRSLGVKGTRIKILNEKILDSITGTPRNLSNECS